MTANISNADRLSVSEVKEQILANCTSLYPIFHSFNGQVVPQPTPRPELTILTFAASNSICAKVVYEPDAVQCNMLVGAPALNHRQAYENLLTMMDQLVKTRSEGANGYFYWEVRTQQWQTEAGGTFGAYEK